MPLSIRIAVIGALGVLLEGGIAARTARGSAILMELGAGVTRVLCL